MPRYYRESTYHRQVRFIKRIKRIVLTFLIVIAFVGCFIVYDMFRSSRQAGNLGDPVQTNSTFTSSFEIHRTQYFQFQASKKWAEIASETKNNHYVYRSFDGPLVEQELVIDVNNTSPEVLALVQITRVLPVSIADKGRLVIEGQTEEHCLKAVKPGGGRNPQIVTQHQVTFACNPDSPLYGVVVGLIGGSDIIPITRPDGTKVNYKITYKNLTALPNSRDLRNIIETFEAR